MLDRNNQHQKSYGGLGVGEIEVNELLDVERKGLLDFYGNEMQLFPCQITMGNSVITKALVTKGSFKDKLTATSFKYLIGLKHHMLVSVLNYYHRGAGGNGWFAVAPVQGSFEGWLKSTKGVAMFKGTDVKRDMSLMFRTMIM